MSHFPRINESCPCMNESCPHRMIYVFMSWSQVLHGLQVCCSVLQCVAVWWSVLRCVAVCCSVLQCVAGPICKSVISHAWMSHVLIEWWMFSCHWGRSYMGCKCVASVLKCVAVCCSALQCVAVCCSMLQWVAVRCNVLQCVAGPTCESVISHVWMSHVLIE